VSKPVGKNFCGKSYLRSKAWVEEYSGKFVGDCLNRSGNLQAAAFSQQAWYHAADHDSADFLAFAGQLIVMATRPQRRKEHT
jgi:hypothetical protein